MIYLFNDVKELTGTVRNNHILNLLYEREKNGIYSVSAEIPVTYNDQGTVYNYSKKIQKSDFLGHYDKEGRFQLHKIAAVDIENGSIFVKGIHIFFDEAKAGAIIKDRRFVNREIIDGARVAFESIGWSVADFDVSVGKTYNFYNVTPLEARQILVETFGFEFDYWLDFDGKKVTNRHVAVKEKIGEKTNKRYTYGHNVLNIRAEQDYSEIYTAVIGRGKGEEIEETGGYGRRIEYTDVVWSKPSKPLNKPAGTRVLEDPNATQLFGYKENGVVKPRVKVEVFSDIESPTELIQASYEWLMDNNVPKAVFSLKVADGDGLNLGDEVYVIYRDIDLIKSARVEKVIDDLVSGNRDVEFGDTAYFDTDRRLSGLRADLKRYSGETGDRIYRLKMEFNRRFDDEVQQWKDDFEQALIDAEAAVEAMRVTMTEEFEAAQKAFEVEFNQSVSDAKKHADAVADEKASQVQGNLDSFAGRHEQLVGELQGNIVNINGEIADARADVSGILGRLTGVDGSISGIEGSLTGIKGSLTEIEGTLTNTKTQLESQITDARTELEQSISSTRTALEGKIATTEEALNKVGEDLGNAKTDLQKQLDEARAELEGLEVGARNYHRNITEEYSKSPVYTVVEAKSEKSLLVTYAVEQTSTPYVFLRDIEPLNTNEEYTINFYATLLNPVEEYERISLVHGIRGVYSDQNVILRSNERTRITFTFTANSESGKMILFPRNYNKINKPVFLIEDVMLTKGNMVVDYEHAPEDTEQKITNINQTITNIEGELSSKVEQTEVDALKGTVTAQGTLLTQTAEEVSSKAEKSVVDTLTGRVTNTESSVTQNAAEIAKKLTKSVYDSDKKATDAKITQWSNTATETAEGLTRVIGRVSETEAGVETAQTRIEAEAGRIDGLLSRTSEVEGKVSDAELAIKANADGLALRATKTEVEQAIDGIEVGGRNLILDSAKELSGKGSRSEFLATYDLEPIFEKYGTDRKYSLSLELKSADTSNANSISVYMQNGSGTKHNFVNKSVEVSEEYRRFTFEGLTPSLSKETEIKSTLAFYGGYNTGNTPIVKNVKLELGNKATDWTPAPEDIDASISEVTDRVTTAEAELVVQAGEISQKATQSELDRVTGRVSKAETSITQNATEIARRLVKSDYDSDKQATDAEITKWSNLTTETAEGLEQTISRVSTAEGKISKAQADIIANADEIALKATQSDLDSVTGRVSTAESELSVQAGQIALRATKKELEGVEGRVSATEASLTVLDDEISSVVGRVSTNESNISSVVQDVNSITSTVATLEGDVATQGSKIEQTEAVISSKVWMDDIAGIGANLIPQSANAWERGGLWIENGGETGVNNSMRMVNKMTIKPSTQYTISDSSAYVSAINNIYIHQYSSTGAHITYRTIPRGGEVTFTTWSNADTIRVSISPMEGFVVLPHFIEHLDGRIKVKLEEGSVATPMVNAISHLQQTADNLSFKVAELTNINGEDILTQSDISIESDRILIGSQQISSNTLASLISVSPSSIDLITDKMNLTGNLNVKGQIESISTSAVKADFANIFAGTADIQFIVAKHLASDSIQARHLLVTNAMAEKIIANSVMAREIKSLSIDAVEANIGSIRSKILTSDVIKSSHIAGGTALIDKIFSSTAMFERMMTKSGFVRTLNTVTIDTDQITIRRPDGYQIVNNGVPNWDFSYADTQPRFFSSGSSITGTYYTTSNDVYTTVDATYFQHNTRYVNLRGYAYMYRQTTNPVFGGNVRLSTFGEGSNNVSNIAYIPRKENSQGSPMFINLTLDLGKPDGSLRQIYTQTKVSNSDGYDEIRFRRLLLRFHG